MLPTSMRFRANCVDLSRFVTFLSICVVSQSDTLGMIVRKQALRWI